MKKIGIGVTVVFLGCCVFLVLRYQNNQGANSSRLEQPAVRQPEVATTTLPSAVANKETTCLALTLANATEENARRLAALSLFDDHLGSSIWTATPELDLLQPLLKSALSDPSLKVREAALDSIRRTIENKKLERASGVSAEKIVDMNTNRATNRIAAADLLVAELLRENRAKELMQYLTGKCSDDLAVQAGHVLCYLLDLNSEGLFADALNIKSDIDRNGLSTIQTFWITEVQKRLAKPK